MTATTTAASASIQTGTWTLDPLHSNAQFRVRHFGISWLRGRLEEFDLQLSSNTDGTLELSGSAPVSGIVTRDPNLAGHLQSPDFFDAELHPRIDFRSVDVVLDEDGAARVTGELTIRGVSAPVELAGSWSGPIADLYGNDRMALELGGDIDRHAYGLSWNAPLAGGGEVLGPKVRLEGDFELVRQ